MICSFSQIFCWNKWILITTSNDFINYFYCIIFLQIVHSTYHYLNTKDPVVFIFLFTYVFKLLNYVVVTLALGSWPRQGLARMWDKGSPKGTSYTPGSAKECQKMNPHTPKWAPILESDYRGQNPLDWKVIYIIGKLLKRRCLKWACMTHLDT